MSFLVNNIHSHTATPYKVQSEAARKLGQPESPKAIKSSKVGPLPVPPMSSKQIGKQIEIWDRLRLSEVRVHMYGIYRLVFSSVNNWRYLIVSSLRLYTYQLHYADVIRVTLNSEFDAIIHFVRVGHFNDTTVKNVWYLSWKLGSLGCYLLSIALIYCEYKAKSALLAICKELYQFFWRVFRQFKILKKFSIF